MTRRRVVGLGGIARRRLGRVWGQQSLLPKLFGAFVAVLALASLTTLVIETGLTRDALRRHAEEISREQASIYTRLLRDAEIAAGELRSFVHEATVAGRDPIIALRTLPAPRTLAPRDVAHVFDIDTGRTLDVSRGPGISLDTADLRADDELSFRVRPRVVALDEPDAWAFVYTLPLPTPDGRVVLAVGSRLDASYARGVRQAVGASDVELVVDGRRVASTDATHADTRPSADPTVAEKPIRTADGRRLVHYIALSSGDGWSEPAFVGLLLDDPLAPLDARLGLYRSLMVGVLLLIGAVLALAFVSVLTRPLVKLTRTAQSIADGNLDASFDIERREDEIGQLADALERMRRGLRAQLLVIREQAAALQEAARRIVGERDRERQRLAKDLHDGIQQRLVVLRMQVGLARGRIEADPDQVGPVADGLASSIDQILEDLRATAQALYPAILHDRGLTGALHSLAARSTIRLDLALQPDPLPRLPEELEANAYFLVCEAVTNTFKHARASHIRVAASLERDHVRVEVADDGRGFDPSAVAAASGLQHLRDRVNALGGTLQIVAAPGQGTQVRALLPLPQPEWTDGTPSAALEIEQDSRDAPVDLDVLREAELAEDGVDVLLDRPFADRQRPRDGNVAPS
jgi:signal transduction histidine kinase